MKTAFGLPENANTAEKLVMEEIEFTKNSNDTDVNGTENDNEDRIENPDEDQH